MSRDQRYSARRALLPQILVYDAMRDEVVGTILDLSTEGIGLMAVRPLRQDALYQWRFTLVSGERTREIDCGVEIIRCRQDAASGQYLTGARFILLPRDVAEQIGEWCAAAQASPA